jgi:hypothetical protein
VTVSSISARVRALPLADAPDEDVAVARLSDCAPVALGSDALAVERVVALLCAAQPTAITALSSAVIVIECWVERGVHMGAVIVSRWLSDRTVDLTPRGC